ncbi:MAG: hypothetical protein RIQ54_296 [Candidatus Parcubacteria bacterium]
MVITYAGEGYVRIQHGDITLGVNPVSARTKTSLTLRTAFDVDADSMPDGEIVCPGEYEISDVEVLGFATGVSDSTISTSYLIIWDDIRLFFLADSAQIDMSQLGDIGHIDVLFVPSDGAYDVSGIVKFVRQIHPAIVIPVYQKSCADLVRGLGVESSRSDKFVFKKKDLISGASRIVELEALK